MNPYNQHISPCVRDLCLSGLPIPVSDASVFDSLLRHKDCYDVIRLCPVGSAVLLFCVVLSWFRS